MTPTELERARRISYEDKDGDCLLFSTPSWSRPNSGIIHHLTADFHPDRYIITCKCEIGRIQKRWCHIITGEGNPCKHIKALWGLCKHILEQGGMQ